MFLCEAKKNRPLYVMVFFYKKPMLDMDECIAKKGGAPNNLVRGSLNFKLIQ
jgi:hypothetical protein